jgi:prepilin-type processing-associated H-X9-DG protein
MLCPECGNENPDELQSCRHCGAALGATPAPPPLRTLRTLVLRVGAATLLVAFLSLAYLMYPRQRDPSRTSHCLSNVANLCMVFEMYRADNGDRFPPNTNWREVKETYLYGPEVFVCQAAPYLSCGYAFNASLVGLSSADIHDPVRTVVIFESDRGWNAAGGPELLPEEPRHNGGHNFGYLDGHAAWVPKEAISEQCIWNLSASQHGEPERVGALSP